MSKDTFTREEVATLMRAYSRTEGCGCCRYNDNIEDQIRSMVFEMGDEGQPEFKWSETEEERIDRDRRWSEDRKAAWQILVDAGLEPNRND